MTNDVDTLATALYAAIDDELVTLVTMQAILGYTSEANWLRHAGAHLRHLFPYLPQQPAYNERLHDAAGLMRRSAGSGWSEYGYCASHSRFFPTNSPSAESSETFKGQLDLERHRGRTSGGVIARVMQRIFVLSAAIWI